MSSSDDDDQTRADQEGSAPFTFPYGFSSNKSVILQHYFGKSLQISTDKQQELDAWGDATDEANWKLELDGHDNDNHHVVKFKNTKSGKYLRIFKGGQAVNAAGNGGKLTRFRVYKQNDDNSYKFESINFKNRYISVGPTGISIDNGTQYSEFSVWSDQQDADYEPPKEDEKKEDMEQQDQSAIDPFIHPYLTNSDGNIIMKHYFGETLGVDANKSVVLTHEGNDCGEYSKWKIELDNDNKDDDKIVQIKSIKTGKYIQIWKAGKEANCSGNKKGKLTRFKIKRQNSNDDGNSYKFESCKFVGKYLAVQPKGIAIGNGGKYTEFTLWCDKEDIEQKQKDDLIEEQQEDNIVVATDNAPTDDLPDDDAIKDDPPKDDGQPTNDPPKDDVNDDPPKDDPPKDDPPADDPPKNDPPADPPADDANDDPPVDDPPKDDPPPANDPPADYQPADDPPQDDDPPADDPPVDDPQKDDPPVDDPPADDPPADDPQKDDPPADNPPADDPPQDDDPQPDPPKDDPPKNDAQDDKIDDVQDDPKYDASKNDPPQADDPPADDPPADDPPAVDDPPADDPADDPPADDPPKVDDPPADDPPKNDDQDDKDVAPKYDDPPKEDKLTDAVSEPEPNDPPKSDPPKDVVQSFAPTDDPVEDDKTDKDDKYDKDANDDKADQDDKDDKKDNDGKDDIADDKDKDDKDIDDKDIDDKVVTDDKVVKDDKDEPVADDKADQDDKTDKNDNAIDDKDDIADKVDKVDTVVKNDKDDKADKDVKDDKVDTVDKSDKDDKVDKDVKPVQDDKVEEKDAPAALKLTNLDDIATKGIDKFNTEYCFDDEPQVVIIQHKNGETLQLNSDKNTELNCNGKCGEYAIWIVEFDGGDKLQIIKIKNQKTSKYLRVIGNGSNINCIDNTGDKYTRFKVHVINKNSCKLESCAFKNKYIIISSDGISFGNDSEYTELTFWKQTDIKIGYKFQMSSLCYSIELMNDEYMKCKQTKNKKSDDFPLIVYLAPNQLEFVKQIKDKPISPRAKSSARPGSARNKIKMFENKEKDEPKVKKEPKQKPKKFRASKKNALAAKYGNLMINPTALKPGGGSKLKKFHGKKDGTLDEKPKIEQATIQKGKRKKRKKKAVDLMVDEIDTNDNKIAPHLFYDEKAAEKSRKEREKAAKAKQAASSSKKGGSSPKKGNKNGKTPNVSDGDDNKGGDGGQPEGGKCCIIQ